MACYLVVQVSLLNFNCWLFCFVFALFMCVCGYLCLLCLFVVCFLLSCLVLCLALLCLGYFGLYLVGNCALVTLGFVGWLFAVF